MEIHLDKHEVIEAVTSHATSKDIDVKSVSIVITWDATAFNFPPNIVEILAHCEVKAVVQVQ